MTTLLMFLGAGASRAFGIPTMKEFVERFEQQLRSSKWFSKSSGKEIELYSEIRDVVTQYYDVVDLETVFSIIDGLIQGDPRTGLSHYATYYYHSALREAFKTITSSFHDRISKRVELAKSLKQKFEAFVLEECQISDRRFDHMMNVYGDLFAKLSQQERATESSGGSSYGDWTIYTTNYDTCMESFCKEAKIRLETGFTYDSLSRDRVPDWAKLDGKGPKLAKLHGSVNWLVREGGFLTEQEVVAPRAAVGRGRFVERRMLYPIDQKAIYLDPYFQLYYRLKRDLKLVDRWIVIGYSFNDPVIAQIFVEASSDNKRIAFVHPHAKNIVKRKLGSLKGRIDALPFRFGERDFADVNDRIRKLFGSVKDYTA